MASTEHAVHWELAYQPPKRQPFDRRDLLVVGAAAGAGAVVALAANGLGLPRLQPLVGLILIIAVLIDIWVRQANIFGVWRERLMRSRKPTEAAHA